MSLYLCIFDENEEVDGIDVGAYSDFDHFRQTVTKLLENGKWGARFPVLMLHSDSDGEWSVEACDRLRIEIEIISTELKQQPAGEFFSEWQKKLAKTLGLRPANLCENFIDVDGELLLVRLLSLIKLAQQRQLPILFQ